MKTAYLSLGSNVGDRAGYLQSALDALNEAGIRIARQSSIYETEPQDRLDQPRFLNMVVEIETQRFPMQLLSQTQKIERALGRQRLVHKGPRTIDIDILLFGNFVIQTERLHIPHPRLAQRRFVLEPLAELVPDLRLPVDRKSVRELLHAVCSQGVRRWSEGTPREKKPGTGQVPG